VVILTLPPPKKKEKGKKRQCSASEETALFLRALAITARTRENKMFCYYPSY